SPWGPDAVATAWPITGADGQPDGVVRRLTGWTTAHCARGPAETGHEREERARRVRAQEQQVVGRTLRVRRQLVAAAAVATAAALVAGCSAAASGQSAQGVPGGSSSSSSSSSSSATVVPADLSVTPADGTTGVLPSSPVVVQAKSGTLTSVTVKAADGRPVQGSLENGTWTSTGRLVPDTAYTVSMTATGSDGTPGTSTSSFHTLKPAVTATYGILYSGQTVGIGMPASIQFDTPVSTKAERAEVEKLVTVTTSPKVEGHWGWLDNRQLMWRPVSYWKPGTTVTIKAPLTGVQTGPGKWIANDDSASFTVGSAMISTVDIAHHVMTVTQNGKVLRTIPISAGRPGPQTETRSGIKVIIRKEGTVVMDSTTIGIKKGDPGYYKITTQDAMRVTWTGEYLHSAPWSVGSQGSTNVSHGCVNMSPSEAAWMYGVSKAGDVVVFTGSSRVFQPTEGIGVWQYSYADWVKQSALV
ncbi:Ig-like domain-containing protein, partial [Pedococcus sp. NPDC057267]|uniref:L,D-transpeptidase n=1 Tax=Pedococcus sp. NPDC057267 TaxID=3346077 RepID=UPI00362959EE